LPTIHNAVVAAGQLGSTVSLADGVVVGNDRDRSGILSFKGIPYATPPIGALRWTPTRPPSPWNGTVNATQFGYTCWSNLVGAGAPSTVPHDTFDLAARTFPRTKRVAQISNYTRQPGPARL
jgi:hypothetical protein